VFGWAVQGEYAAKQDERHEDALKIFCMIVPGRSSNVLLQHCDRVVTK
jgi:hypothetical protein